MPGLFLAGTLHALAPSGVALGLPLQITQYAHTAWTAAEGADMGAIFAMAQTPDGYLWIAGSFGLFRFDGLRFVRWEPPGGQALPGGPYSLLVSRDGTLWIGTYNGLSSWNGSVFVRQYPQIAAGFVTALLEDREGTVWAGLQDNNAGRLCTLRAGQVRCAEPEGGFGTFVWSLAEDPAGSLWVGAGNGVWHWRPGAPSNYPMPGLRVADLSLGADGQVLAGVMGGGVLKVAGDELVPHRFRHATRPEAWFADGEVKSNKLLRDRDGGLWIGTQGLGLVHVKDGHGDTYTRTEGLSGNIACSLFQDREGNIWYGSERGLDRFRKLPVVTVSSKQGLPNELTRSILATRDGSVWVATSEGLARWQDGAPIVYRKRDGLPDSDVQSQYEDADGRHWVSTAKGGLAYFAGRRFVAVDGGPNTEIYAITGDAAGDLWLSGDKGLARMHQGRFVDSVPWAALGHPQRRAQVAVADPGGGVWLGFWHRSLLLYVKDGQVQATYGTDQGLGRSHIANLRIDGEGAVWAATGDVGLVRIKGGRVTTLSTANGLPCNRTHWSAADDQGALWMYTVCGLVKVGRDDLAAWIADPGRRVSVQLWGGVAGVQLIVGAPGYFNPPMAKGADDRLWFKGSGEVQYIALADIPFNPVPPPVHVEAVVADHKVYAPGPGLRLPPLTRDITIEFSALTLVDPKTAQFRYRLEGQDNDWQDAVDRRLATYTNLAPGNYRFRVKAANNSGVWNEEGAQLTFSIEPAFYQTTWFRIAGAVLLAGLVWGAFQLRMRMRILRLQRQFDATLEGRVAERTRIARDLHDTLLQSFHGLLLQLQAASNLLPDRAREANQLLTRAIDQAAEAITEGRDAVQGLRAPPQETSSLADALRTLADEAAKEDGHAAPVQVEVQGRPQPVDPLVGDEILRIAGEALRNAFRHAQAREVEVVLRYGARQLQLQVRDNGQGIAPEVLQGGGKKGHFGLRGMRERAELVGATLAVRSDPQAGTEVEFSAPASRAYGRSAAARSWLRAGRFVPRQSGE